MLCVTIVDAQVVVCQCELNCFHSTHIYLHYKNCSFICRNSTSQAGVKQLTVFRFKNRIYKLATIALHIFVCNGLERSTSLNSFLSHACRKLPIPNSVNANFDTGLTYLTDLQVHLLHITIQCCQSSTTNSTVYL
jgi:hypothetical protein